MKLGLLQLNSTIGDFSGNLSRIQKAYAAAFAQGADLVITPEMFLCGYPPRDLLLRDDFLQSNLAALKSAAELATTVPLCVGYVDANPSRPGKPLHNSAAVVQQGAVLQRFNKSLLPTYDVFDEGRYFEPARSVQVFSWRSRTIAITICEDIWNDQDFWPERLYGRDPIQELIALGADLVINLSASPWFLGKEQTRLAMLQKLAGDERIAVAQVNLVGGNDELIFDGHSSVVDPHGRLLALGKGFAEDILVVDIGPPAQRPVKSSPQSLLAPAASTVPSEPKPASASIAFQTSPISSEAIPNPHHKSDSGVSPAQNLFLALSLGLRDYVRKCGFKSVVVGLSGGIDSALTAVLAADALGPEHVMGIAMPSRFSSEGSVKDAQELARTLGIQFEIIPIEPMVSAAEAQLQPLFAGRPRNEAEENIQSRMRGLLLMAVSNKLGSLVLTTGNKSELSVGYCTLYGDMCGALGVVSDLLKTEIYQIARWINRERIIIPEDSILKPPSAELRPNQTDQDSLPPYEMLDAILSLYVVQDCSRETIQTKGFDPTVVNDVINKVNFSEYKRRQAAPGLKVSPRAFGMGRRIPIAQRFRT